MADEQVATPVEAETAPAPVSNARMTVEEALPEVLKQAMYVDGLARGLHEVAKVLSKGSAHLCVLATNCDEPNIIKLIEALCAEQKISLLKVDDKMKLGQWAGLCKLDQDGNPRKVVKCSCVAVTNYGVAGQAVEVINDHFKGK